MKLTPDVCERIFLKPSKTKKTFCVESFVTTQPYNGTTSVKLLSYFPTQNVLKCKNSVRMVALKLTKDIF